MLVHRRLEAIRTPLFLVHTDFSYFLFSRAINYLMQRMCSTTSRVIILRKNVLYNKPCHYPTQECAVQQSWTYKAKRQRNNFNSHSRPVSPQPHRPRTAVIVPEQILLQAVHGRCGLWNRVTGSLRIPRDWKQVKNNYNGVPTFCQIVFSALTLPLFQLFSGTAVRTLRSLWHALITLVIHNSGRFTTEPICYNENTFEALSSWWHPVGLRRNLLPPPPSLPFVYHSIVSLLIQSVFLHSVS
jgi:hypothetical protein